jgi:hypothetical protein
MKKTDARKKLEGAGYKVFALAKGYVAQKGNKMYFQNSLNGLVNKLFKK